MESIIHIKILMEIYQIYSYHEFIFSTPYKIQQYQNTQIYLTSHISHRIKYSYKFIIKTLKIYHVYNIRMKNNI